MLYMTYSLSKKSLHIEKIKVEKTFEKCIENALISNISNQHFYFFFQTHLQINKHGFYKHNK